MTRLRIWLLTVLTALAVAGPTVAYWPVLFAVPAVFGQEESPVAESKRSMPYVEPAPHSQADARCDGCCCEELGECLTTWRKLWQQGRFREAMALARRAVHAAPDSVEARHAFVVSQMVMQSINDQPHTIVYPTFTPSGILPAGTLTPDLDVPIQSAKFDCECESCCPLFKLFATIFGGCKECVGAKCEQCPAGTSCCKNESAVQCMDLVDSMIQRKLEMPHDFHWKDARLSDVVADLKTITGINVTLDEQALRSAGVCPNTPLSLDVENIKLKSALNMLVNQCNLGYVIKDHCLQITTADKAARCCEPAQAQPSYSITKTVRGPQGTTVIYIVREPVIGMPPMPSMSQIVSPVPALAEAPLPPPCMAPPPPPLVSVYSDTPYIPVPVVAPPPVALQPGFAYGYSADGKIIRSEMPVPARPLAPPQPVQRILYDPAEQCAAPTPAVAPMPANVQITQHGSRVRMSSPHYHAQCDRIRGGADGQIILEGNVQLMSHRHGQTMSITAQRVLLNVKDDQFVVERAEGMQSSRVNIAPVGCDNECGDVRVPRGEWHGDWILQGPITPARVHGGVGP